MEYVMEVGRKPIVHDKWYGVCCAATGTTLRSDFPTWPTANRLTPNL
jgi:hypothetical protein